jgi:hypothetical protein
VFFPIGGVHLGKAMESLKVNADHTILDNIITAPSRQPVSQ